MLELRKVWERKANHGIMHRLLNAWIREGVEPFRSGFVQGNKEQFPAYALYYQADVNQLIVIEKPETTARLILPVAHEGAFGRYQFACPILVEDEQGIAQAEELLTWLQWLRDQFALQLPDSLVRELVNSRDNLILAYEALENKKERFQRRGIELLGDGAHREWSLSFPVALKSLQNKGFDALTYSEGMVIEGHPLHPCTKTKWGMTAEEVKRYAPEFEQDIPLRAVLVPKDRVVVTSPDGQDFHQILASAYPALKEAIAHALDGKGDLEDYQLFLIHPWQWEHTISRLFAEERNQWIEVPFEMKGKATLSFRTLSLLGSGYHLKLPVCVQATSAVRTVSPASAVNGPHVTRLLQRLIHENREAFSTLEILPDLIGVHYASEADHDQMMGRNLAFILRENPNRFVEEGELAFVGASLTAESILSPRPVLIDLVEEYAQKPGRLTVDDALEFIVHYATQFLTPLVRLLSDYGVALEAHMQNSMVVTEKGRIKRFIIRDMGGIRIGFPRLKERVRIEMFAPSGIYRQTMDEAFHLFYHSVVQNHLGELVFVLARYFRTEEKPFWRAIREVLVKELMKGPNGAEDRKALLQPKVKTKALFAMRMDDAAQDYLFTEVKNPLA